MLLGEEKIKDFHIKPNFKKSQSFPASLCLFSEEQDAQANGKEDQMLSGRPFPPKNSPRLPHGTSKWAGAMAQPWRWLPLKRSKAEWFGKRSGALIRTGFSWERTRRIFSTRDFKAAAKKEYRIGWPSAYCGGRRSAKGPFPSLKRSRFSVNESPGLRAKA